MVVVITARTLLAIAFAALVLAGSVLALLPGTRQTVATTLWPREVASSAALDVQLATAENGVQRGYVRASGRLDQVRKLTLAIPASDAAAISQRAAEELAGVRRQALAALGRAGGRTGADLEGYVATAEARLGTRDAGNAPVVLLAPTLYGVVRAADEAYARVADAATRELTRSASPPPSRTP